MPNKITHMVLTKSTIGTHTYSACDTGGATVRTICIHRGSLPNSPPKTVKVTVNYDE